MNYIKFLFGIFAVSLSGFSFAHNVVKPLIIGEHAIIHSKILEEDRAINIYLPEDYKPFDSIKYSVIYVLDGGIEEDFFHVAGIVRFNTQPWIDRFPRCIVVGIEGNTRRRDFTLAVDNTDFIEKEGFKKSSFPQYGGSEKYMNFLECELLPYLGKHYSVSGKNTIIGESLAGLFATEVLLKRPYLFSDYIIISPSLWWGQSSLLQNVEKLLNANLNKDVQVYIGVPNKEEDVAMFTAAQTLYQSLKYNKKITAIFDYIPDELHATVIHQAVYNAFKKLYTKTALGK